jgi:hypothetical protein
LPFFGGAVEMEVFLVLDHRLLHAKYTRHWSKGFMKFIRIVSLHSTPAGKIVLDLNELAQKVGVQVQTIRKYFRLATQEELISQTGFGFRFNYPVHFDNHEKGYVPHFRFLESETFADLTPFAQRFICHALANGVHSGRKISIPFKHLYSSTFRKGLFTCRSIKTALNELEQVKSFLDIEISMKEREVVIRGIADNVSLDIYQNTSQGIEIYKLARAFYVHHNLTDESVTSILQVKKGYANKYGIIYAEKLFEKVLPRLYKNPSFHTAVNEGTIGPLVQSLCQHVSKEYPEMLEKCIQEELRELNNFERSLPVFRERGLYKYVRSVKTKISERVDGLRKLYLKILDHPQLKFDSEKRELQNIYQLISNHSKRAITIPIEFPYYNWLEANN